MDAKSWGGFPNRRSKHVHEYDGQIAARVPELSGTLPTRGECLHQHVCKVLAVERVEGLDFRP